MSQSLHAPSSADQLPPHPFDWRAEIFKSGKNMPLPAHTCNSCWRAANAIQAIAYILNANWQEKVCNDGPTLSDDLAGDLHLGIVELADSIITQLSSVAAKDGTSQTP